MPSEPRRYLCERCGGTGQQVAGLWNTTTERYDAPAGVCDGCKGSGYLGLIEQPLDLHALLAIVRRRTPGELQFIGDEYEPRALWSSTGGVVAIPIEGDGAIQSRSDLRIDIHPKDQRAICTAVNNFEPLAERCKRAEEVAELRLRELIKVQYQVGELARQHDELLAALKAVANSPDATNKMRIMVLGVLAEG